MTVFLRLVFGTAVLLLGLGTAVGAQTVRVAVSSDLHVLAASLQDDGPAYRRYAASGAGRDILHTEDLLDAWERDLAADPPDWLLITGDLTNNGERESHRSLAVRLARIASRGTSVLVIPGNHDVANPWSRAFRDDRQLPAETVTAHEFASIYREFGYGRASSRDRGSLSYTVEAGRLWFLMLDTNRYQDNAASGQPVTGGRLTPQTLEWIRDRASAARKAGARILVGQHHNLFDHSEVIARGFTIDNAGVVAEIYRQEGLRLVLSGHIHIQDAVSRDGTTDIASNALSVYPNQYGRLEVDPAAGRVRYRTREVDVEGWARAVGKTDPELRDYEAWSARSFGDTARRLVLRSLADLDEVQAAQAGATMAKLNQRYFAGREGLNTDLGNDPGLSILLNADSGFLADYTASILEDDGTDDNSLDLRF